MIKSWYTGTHIYSAAKWVYTCLLRIHKE